MILTCPECASRYVVDEARIGPQGRTVRCAGCGGTWRATATAIEPPLELRPQSPPAEDPLPRPAAAALPRQIRDQRVARRRTRQAAVAGVVWGVMGAAVLSLTAGAALFRVEVVRLWPRTAGAYAKVGLPVNPTGLAPENVVAAAGLKDGHAAVIVSGMVRNIETRANDPAALRISLLDKAGKPVATQLAALAPGKLQPGQTRPFTIAFLDPPSASVDVQVEFALEAPSSRGRAPAAQVEAHAPPPRGPAATGAPQPLTKTAEALPADSPYALPAGAHGPAAHSGHDG